MHYRPISYSLKSSVVHAGICTGCGVCVGLDDSKTSFMKSTSTGPLPNFDLLKSDLPPVINKVCPALNLDYIQLYKDLWNQNDHNPITGKVIKLRTG